MLTTIRGNRNLGVYQPIVGIQPGTIEDGGSPREEKMFTELTPSHYIGGGGGDEDEEAEEESNRLAQKGEKRASDRN